MTETALEAAIRWLSCRMAAWTSIAAAAAALSLNGSVGFDPGGSKHRLYPKPEAWSKLCMELRNLVCQMTKYPLVSFLVIYSKVQE